MEDYLETDQSPAQVRQGLEALKHVQSSDAGQKNDRGAIDERLKQAKKNQREFVIRLYATSAIVIAILSVAIYLTIRFS